MAGRLLLGIRLGFDNHAKPQLTRGLAFDQAAADELRPHQLSGARKEGLGESWEVVGDGLCGYGSLLKTALKFGSLF